MKNKDAEGADPTNADPRPLYNPLKPPLLKKPPDACSLVFKVSMGKNVKSVAVPAHPPLTSDTKK